MRASRTVVEGYIKLGTIVSVALTSLFLVFVVAHRLWADLPAEQWLEAKISEAPGTSSYSGPTTDTFTISAGGTGIKGGSDSCYLLYRPVQGNVEITARVGALQNTTPHATAGVMLRESTATDSQSVYLSVSPDKGITQTTRSFTGSVSSVLNGPSQVAPVWLKLVRSGGVQGATASASYTLSSYYSNNGVSWTLVGSQTLTMASAVQMGLAVASNDAAAVSTVMMDGVSALTLVPQPSSNLVLWLRSDAGLTVDGSNRVSVWEDQSGNGNHATPPTLTNSPTLSLRALNGLPTVQFNSTNATRLSITNSATLNPASGKVSVIAVTRRSSDTAVGRVLSKYISSSPSSGYLVDFTSATAVRSWIGGNAATGTFTGSSCGVIASVYDQALNKIYVNGGAPVVSTYSTQ